MALNQQKLIDGLVAAFEEGMKLARICSDMLTSAELKISRIRTAYGDQAYMAEDEMNP